MAEPVSAPAPVPSRPRFYQDPYETWADKFKRKFNENPWVPIGCLATCGALVMSGVKMRQGDSQTMNYWMRARVALQGLTIVAVVAGSMALQKRRSAAELAEAQPTEDEEKKRARERAEFEGRLREAEKVVEMEAGAGLAGQRTVKGPTVNRDEEHRRVEEQQKAAGAASLPATGATSAAVKKTSSWKWWSSKSSSTDDEKNAAKSSPSDEKNNAKS